MFQHQLTDIFLKWYEENKRDLPWRRSNNPYHIWVSEIILQQTRVDQGLDYFKRFILAFPSIKELAAANEDEVLTQWQGLGYYSRARNLHKGAKQVLKEYAGNLPENYADLLKISGIGPYTAAAISSIAFQKTHPVIDGNVHRVISRLYNITEPVNTPAGHKIILEKMEDLISRKNPGDFNQAVMEFGALWCSPKTPKCKDCPFQLKCASFQLGTTTKLPIKKPKKPLTPLFLSFFIIRNSQGQIQVTKRGPESIWKGLYQFPILESPQPLSEIEMKQELALRYGKPKDLIHIETIKQNLTHKKLTISFFEVTGTIDLEGFIGISESDFEVYAFPQKLKEFIFRNNLNLPTTI